MTIVDQSVSKILPNAAIKPRTQNRAENFCNYCVWKRFVNLAAGVLQADAIDVNIARRSWLGGPNFTAKNDQFRPFQALVFPFWRFRISRPALPET